MGARAGRLGLTSAAECAVRWDGVLAVVLYSNHTHHRVVAVGRFVGEDITDLVNEIEVIANGILEFVDAQVTGVLVRTFCTGFCVFFICSRDSREVRIHGVMTFSNVATEFFECDIGRRNL